MLNRLIRAIFSADLAKRLIVQFMWLVSGKESGMRK